MKHSISVVIPLYNKASHIGATLDSVLKQSFSAHEVLIIDDGSSDNSVQVVEAYINQHYANNPNSDVKLQLIKQKNMGVSATRNKGVKLAHAAYVAFLDADDLWTGHFLAQINQLADDFPQAGLLATSYQFLRGDYFTDPKIKHYKQHQHNFIMHDYFKRAAYGDLPFMMSSVAVKRASFDFIGGFPLDEPMGEDQDFFVRAALRSSIAYSPKALALYVLDTDNRACKRHLPSSACPFGVRLKQWALCTANFDLREDMQAYYGAHIMHLVSLNIKAGKLEVAATLLRDESLLFHARRFAYWYGRYVWACGARMVARYTAQTA